MERHVVTGPGLPNQIGPYSPAVTAGGLVHVAGQPGIDPVTGEKAGPGFEEQARQAFANLASVLSAAGSRPDLVVATTVLVADQADFPAMNAAFAEFFPADPPTRMTMQVPLPLGLLVSVGCTAVVADVDSDAARRMAILAAAVDYIESWLDGDPGRMARALHVDLVKREIVAGPEAGEPVIETITRDEMVGATENGYRRRHDRPYDAEVLDDFGTSRPSVCCRRSTWTTCTSDCSATRGRSSTCSGSAGRVADPVAASGLRVRGAMPA